MTVTNSEGERPTGRGPRLVYLLNVAQRRVQAAIQGEGEGTTAARAGLLMAVGERGAAMAQLGPMLDLGAPALSGLIDRCMKAGLVERRPDPGDGRAWFVVLTEAGRKARVQAIEGARALNARLIEGFTDNEVEAVARWLEAVRDRFPREKDR
ncbi:MarR family winged helix-turn-helix transcriptional regulator [Allosphingosinicella deserti]|uniref:MarR family transcriptional regulator n=1 Tax=Allosphingosinicella deserti TaxID=2116704 RepID=A0A2P7QND6_9SPHN|nr:MarR family transcriptional regulator [Sphingomonas deserti]PSJ39489.1 MarR family transcriptional regulator [Sphingomonas deserti]